MNGLKKIISALWLNFLPQNSKIPIMINLNDSQFMNYSHYKNNKLPEFATNPKSQFPLLKIFTIKSLNMLLIRE